MIEIEPRYLHWSEMDCPEILRIMACHEQTLNVLLSLQKYGKLKRHQLDSITFLRDEIKAAKSWIEILSNPLIGAVS